MLLRTFTVTYPIIVPMEPPRSKVLILRNTIPQFFRTLIYVPLFPSHLTNILQLGLEISPILSRITWRHLLSGISFNDLLIIPRGSFFPPSIHIQPAPNHSCITEICHKMQGTKPSGYQWNTTILMYIYYMGIMIYTPFK